MTEGDHPEDSHGDDKTPTGPHRRRRRSRAGHRSHGRPRIRVSRFRWWHLPLAIVACLAAIKLTIILLTPATPPPAAGAPSASAPSARETLPLG